MLSERVYSRRMQLGLSQEALQQKAGVSHVQISRYERGVTKPTSDVLAMLADALETSADYLLGRTEDPTPPVQDYVADQPTTNRERQILRQLRDNQPMEAIKLILET